MILNGAGLIYIFERFSPFFIVSYFVLNSILQLDYKGLIYISGLLLASCIIKLLGDKSTFENPKIELSDTTNPCLEYTLGTSSIGYIRDGPFSKIPLSLVVFSYTFTYLLYFIITSNLLSVNLVTITFFIYLIFVELHFLSRHSCSHPMNMLCGILVGGVIGVLWASIIKTSNNADLYYFNGINNAGYCTIAKERKYKCTFNKNS